jgi:Cyanate lyase C-terminal domain
LITNWESLLVGYGASRLTHPTLSSYRCYELVLVNGPAWKALIEEEFGDGIMSAIDFDMVMERLADPKGDRVKITIDYGATGNARALSHAIPIHALRARRSARLVRLIASTRMLCDNKNNRHRTPRCNSPQ